MGQPVLLVGGFVGYRAGAFDWLVGTTAPPETTTVVVPVAGPGTIAQPDRTFMYSSKSIILAEPLPPGSPVSSTTLTPAPSK